MNCDSIYQQLAGQMNLYEDLTRTLQELNTNCVDKQNSINNILNSIKSNKIFKAFWDVYTSSNPEPAWSITKCPTTNQLDALNANIIPFIQWINQNSAGLTVDMIPTLSTTSMTLTKNVDFSKLVLNPGTNKSFALILKGNSRGFQLGNLDKPYVANKSFAIMCTVPNPLDAIEFGEFISGKWTYDPIYLEKNFYPGRNFLIINSVGTRLDFLFNTQLLSSIVPSVNNLELTLSPIGSRYDPGINLEGDLISANTFSLNDLKIFKDYCIFGDYNK